MAITFGARPSINCTTLLIPLLSFWGFLIYIVNGEFYIIICVSWRSKQDKATDPNAMVYFLKTQKSTKQNQNEDQNTGPKSDDSKLYSRKDN